MKDKYEFILELLETGKLTPAQKERVMLLSTNIIKDSSQKENEILERIKKIEEMIKKGENPEPPTGEEKNLLIHRPDYITRYLQKFGGNSAFKWATHIWEERKYETIIDFIEELNKDKEYQKIYNCNRDLYNLIRYFLYKPKQNLDKNGVPEFGWPKLNDIKIGWQYPDNLLVKWCNENYDNKTENFRYPFEYTLPNQILPERLVRGEMISTFENVVEIFKTEIQFRDNYLYKEIKKIQRQTADFEFEGIDDFQNLVFYTYTYGILTAFKNVISEIKKRETAKKIFFDYKMTEHELIIDITHENSYPTRILNTNNLAQFMGGGIKTIASNVFSLCDFSVISKFKNQEGIELKARLSILHNGLTAQSQGKDIIINYNPILEEWDKEINGFTYRFKFHI